MIPCLLQTFVDRAALKAPDLEAVTDGELRLSYRDLDVQSTQLARALVSGGVERGEHVALCLPHSPQSVVAMIGVLKADAVYVPILADTPGLRRRKIFQDCRPKAVIGDGQSLQRILTEDPAAEVPRLLVAFEPQRALPRVPGLTVITSDRLTSLDTVPLSFANDPDDVACLLYTSGSTGNPKGVMLTHRNIVEYAAWGIECIGIRKDDRVLGTAPFHFVMSLFDIYGSLGAGATLCIANEKRLLFPRLLVDFAEAERVIIWKGVSSHLMYLVRTGAVSKDRLPTLQTILFSGEVLHTKYLIQWMSMFPDKVFYSAYGFTETTGVAMFYRVERRPQSDDERIPIGRPYQNIEALLLDDKGRPVADGEPGELYIRGVRVAKGYLNDTEKTRSVFSDNPANPMRGDRTFRTGDYARLNADGNYEFLGRKDNRVKYMGYRIELSDIEQSLISIGGVRDAGVILTGSGADGLEELVAYLEIDDTVTLAQVADELKIRLPVYMIPKEIFAIPRLPRSERGKIDRKSLLEFHQEKARR
jgi:amino acid adenylation domain-containing protein